MKSCIPESYPVLREVFPSHLVLLGASLAVLILPVPFPGLGVRSSLWDCLRLMLGIEVVMLVSAGVLGRFMDKSRIPPRFLDLVSAIKVSHPADLLATSAEAGLVEELAFRGILYPLLGPLPSSFLFAIGHRPKSPIHLTLLMLMGWLFAYETAATGGLLIPMLHHAGHDFLTLTALRELLRRHPGAFDETGSPPG